MQFFAIVHSPAVPACKSFLLEAVVAVGVFASDPSDEAGQQVGGNEERSPALVLGHVDTFVLPGLLECRGADGQNDMPERDGPRSPLQERAVAEEESHPRTGDFKGALDATHVLPRRQIREGEEDSQQGVWGGPEVGSQSTHVLVVRGDRQL